MSRTLRQFVIASIFFFFVALLLWGVYVAFIKAPETCSDAKQNQNEEGIDCGGICTAACIEEVVGKDLQIQEVTFVLGGANTYDILGRFFNPNSAVGASEFRYTFELQDASGQVLATRSGKNYALPQETKDIIELNIETAGMPVKATLTVSDVIWEKASGYREKPAVNIYQKRYSSMTSGFGFSKASGLLSNESPYDFRSIDVGIILRDASGRLLALNKTRQNNIKAGESRDFDLVWPLPFPGIVEQVDMEVDADVYHSENFSKQYFPGGSAR